MAEAVVDLERRYGGFYAPAFRIEVQGEDVVADRKLEVASAQVDQTLKGADQFSFTVNNGFDLARREFRALLDFFEIGAPVSIEMGYRDDLAVMLVGLVTSVATSFPASGLPQIVVSGYDRSYVLMKGKYSYNWPDKKDSDVVSDVVGKPYDFKTRITDSKVVHPKVEQNQESDFHLIERLAERNGFEFYMFGEELRFGPPDNDLTEILTLEWGAGLLSFTPELNFADQVSRVEVVGWDVRRKKEIVGRAGSGDEPGRDPQRRSGADIARKVFPEEAVLRVRRPVYSQSEAEARAKAILKARSERFLTGSGESIGIPTIRPDQNIRLAGVGADFNKPYYVEQCTHTVSGAGYRTTFKVKETTA